MVGRTGAAPTSHELTQFLKSVLSQRGPQALPYVEDDKWSIRQHLLLVIQGFPGLQVKTAVFTHNDDRTSNLLQADGLMPMYYQKVQYNIPITLWLLETYPRQSPRVLVTPTRDMMIKHRHPFVDGSGMVTSVYIQHWTYPRSNLVELVQSLCLLFGQHPPLYSRPTVRHIRLVNPIHSGGNMQTNPPPSPGASQYAQSLTYPPYRHDPQEQHKRNLVTSLTERVNDC